MPELANDLALSKKIQSVKASGIRIFDNKVSTIPGIIKLTLGEPDMNTPEHVKMRHKRENWNLGKQLAII